ncbi:LLM class flavin-dependent oxidoreductase [Streptomyces minutiscleroticus]|uniref:N5,N10-methylene tetrahydromethanopterin reductase n=1 Tax=Streptomyces minutiscleroticus TaxID=68238 RepID=A0A918KFC1_9ACTN|nr:LLM class flavin-dependent oxidoreductase [Streptomyces minutiscleroticus]GGX59039.1 N5,N10-methylene tetrahydromethanopterin reductase [Streptomyces minutiscleroticus]
MTRPDGTIGVLLPRDIPLTDVVPFAQEADAHGFAELWVVEDLGYRGGLAQAATVLARTRRIRVGVGLLPAAARNVAFTAMEAATLAQLHPGRVDIAVGHGMPGWMRSVGAWPRSPLTLLREYIQTLRTLLAGEPAAVDGRYVRLDGLRLDRSALPSRAPDVLAGVRGPKSLAVSGEVADGTLLAEPVTPEYARQALGSIAPRRPHRLTAYNVAVVHDDPHTARTAARPALQALGDPDWAPHIAPLGFRDELAALRRASGGAREFAQAMPAQWVDRLALAGTPDQVRARIRHLFEAGVTGVVLAPVGPDHRSALAALARVL